MKMLKDRVRMWIQELDLTKKEKRHLLWMGILIILVAVLLQRWENQPFSGILSRNTYGGGTQEVEYQVEINGEEMQERISLEVAIQEEQYTIEELEEVFGTSLELLDTLILGDNETPDLVYYDLNLVGEIPDTGIQVEWSWEPYELLNLEGEIQEDALVEGEGILLELVGVLSYGEAQVIYIRTLCIYPKELNELEEITVQLLEEIATIDGETKEESYIVLPTSLEHGDGYKLIWYENRSYTGWIVFFLGMVVILLLLLRKKEEQKLQITIRKEQLEREYPRLIQTFALYMGAGMTPKNIWKRMVMEQEEKGKSGYLEMEMKRAYFEMSNGISESVCYETFARRCGLRCYQRMGLLLSQNVRKGTKGLTRLLEQEAVEAFQMRKSKAKTQGELAGTKLLMPMFLMLGVVLVMIIIPAFVSIQI